MTRTDPFAEDPAALENRVGTRVAAALTEQAGQLPAGVAQRLGLAREAALQRARASRAAVAALPTPASVQARSALPGATASGVWRGLLKWLARPASPTLWPRLSALAPLLVLIVGLGILDRSMDDEDVRVTADIDARLLADSLPPAAYADPGFAAFLRGVETQ